jgi:hypothetical protein
VAVISDRLWQQRFGGRPDAIGQTLLIQRRPFTVAGVMPPGFHGPDAGRACDIILPLGSEPLVRGADSWLNLRTTTWLRVMARVAPPETFEAASARVRAVQAALRDATMPASRAQNDLAAPLVFLPAAGGVATSVGRDYRLPLQILMAIVALVLLVACANVAALQLVSAWRRAPWSPVRGPLPVCSSRSGRAACSSARSRPETTRSSSISSPTRASSHSPGSWRR